MVIAHGLIRIVEWALWSGLLVYTYETNGKTVAGLVSLALLVPGVTFVLFIGRALDGGSPNRALPLGCAIVTTAVMLSAVAISLAAPLPAVILPATVALTAISALDPSVGVLVPDHARSAMELVAGNVLLGRSDSIGALAGPLMASALLGWSGPVLLFTGCSGLAAVAFVSTLPLFPLDSRGDSATGRPDESPSNESRSSSRTAGFRSLMSKPGAPPLLVILCAGDFLIGALDLMYVVFAKEQFAMASNGPGILTAAFGLGGLIASFGASMLLARRRLAPVALVAVGFISFAISVIACFPRLVVTLTVLPVVGLSVALLRLAAKMLLQRVAPQDSLASIFASVEAFSLLACMSGSVLAQVVIAVAGVRASLMTIGLVFAAMLALTAAGLLTIDAGGDTPIVTMRLLRKIEMFALLPGPALEGVARACAPRQFVSGVAVVREADAAASYFVIVDGVVDVSIAGHHRRTMSRGEGFGEIALLKGVPRTATVTAQTRLDVLELDCSMFLDVVSEHAPSRRAATAVARTRHEAWDHAAEAD